MGTEKVEEFSINGDELLAKVRQIVREGNVRRITIKNEQGDTLVVIPLTIGVIGAALLPVFAAIGALAALATRCTIVVERAPESAATEQPGAQASASAPSPALTATDGDTEAGI